MLIGVIADDFTGASDIANTLAKGGLTATQYIGIPTTPADAGTEAGVIALKSRSIPAGEAVSGSLAALDWLLAQGCEQIVFKYCSTFDSTPAGNIGPVSEALADALNVSGVLMCPAFPAAGRTVHQGHLFVHDRLLNESGMENHPLTPMTDANLRRWLARQTEAPVGLVPAQTVRQGHQAVRDGLAAASKKGDTLVIADAATDDDLLTLGKAAAGFRLVTGGSGIASGLPRNFIAEGKARPKPPAFEGMNGPEAILAGSCSSATLMQIRHHEAAGYPVLHVSVEEVLSETVTAADLLEFIYVGQGRAPLVYSSGQPEAVAEAQERFGRENVASRLETLFAETARAAVSGGVTRLVVAGGETSGSVVQALGIEALRIGPEIAPGVPALVAEGVDLALVLKSGNFGGPTFFADAMTVLAGHS